VQKISFVFFHLGLQRSVLCQRTFRKSGKNVKLSGHCEGVKLAFLSKLQHKNLTEWVKMSDNIAF